MSLREFAKAKNLYDVEIYSLNGKKLTDLECLCNQDIERLKRKINGKPLFSVKIKKRTERIMLREGRLKELIESKKIKRRAKRLLK